MQPIQPMNHTQFVSALSAGKITVQVNRDAASHLYAQTGFFSESARRTQVRLRAWAFGLIALGIALFFFAPWPVAAFWLIVGVFQAPRAYRKAGEDTLAAITASPGAYQLALQENVIRVIPKDFPQFEIG